MDLLFPMTMGVTFFLLNILKNTNDEDTRKLVIFYHLLYHDLFTNCITLIAFKSFCTITFHLCYYTWMKIKKSFHQFKHTVRNLHFNLAMNFSFS